MIDGLARQATLALARERYTLEREDDELVLDDARTEEKHVGWVGLPLCLIPISSGGLLDHLPQRT